MTTKGEKIITPEENFDPKTMSGVVDKWYFHRVSEAELRYDTSKVDV